MAGKRFGGAEAAYGANAASAAGTKRAAEAAIAVLEAGGNVVDAAIAGSAVLAVMIPNATSIGGDLLCLVKVGDAPIMAVNATGAAPKRASIEAYKALGHRFVPDSGGLTVQGPGLVAGWQALHERWATKPLAELLAPAIALARDGFPAGWRVAVAAQHRAKDYAGLPGFSSVFAPGGQPLQEGAHFVQPALARTLATIAEKGPRVFYEGPIARDIASAVQQSGGFLAEDDLAEIKAEVLPVLKARYRGLEVATQPPVTQGLILLRALRLLEELVPDPHRIPAEQFWAHAARALRRAFDERVAILRDGPEARAHAEAIIAGRAESLGLPRFEFAGTADNTSKISVLDRDGNGVSLIQSVFAELGSGVVAPETGILLNNRMMSFFLDPARANHLAPGRRTMHTLHTFMASDGKGLKWIGGSPGADNQPQVNLQVLARILDFGEAPEAAVAAPRWSVVPGTKPKDIATLSPGIECEKGVSPELQAEFAAAGFAVTEKPELRAGSSKIVGRDVRSGELGAFADWRREGDVAAC
ncbi:MAG TPA: gamma-glutamyltransferase [Stellaceae bacterium]|nr:gamma-glutamyltransferase [Stellaceae bacterium]